MIITVLTAGLFATTGGFAQADSRYTAETEQWHKERVEGLKRENGWLNLVGLYWLKPGKNTFGSGEGDDIVFPKGAIAAKAGYFELEDNGSVIMVPASGTDITVNNERSNAYQLFQPGAVRNPSAASGTLRWTIIKRDDKTGIRLRDLQAAALSAFKGIERYAVNPSWRVEATLQSAGFPQQISITNVLGQTNLQTSAGKLVFDIEGRQYRLDALDEGDKLFIIFADKTNTTETYPSGRFLYVNKPDASGKTVIDFNKAYNPPCAFTEFATCPLPPKENSLPVAVTAGEKKYGAH